MRQKVTTIDAEQTQSQMAAIQGQMILTQWMLGLLLAGNIAFLLNIFAQIISAAGLLNLRFV